MKPQIISAAPQGGRFSTRRQLIGDSTCTPHRGQGIDPLPLYGEHKEPLQNYFGAHSIRHDEVHFPLSLTRWPDRSGRDRDCRAHASKPESTIKDGRAGGHSLNVGKSASLPQAVDASFWRTNERSEQPRRSDRVAGRTEGRNNGTGIHQRRGSLISSSGSWKPYTKNCLFPLASNIAASCRETGEHVEWISSDQRMLHSLEIQVNNSADRSSQRRHRSP